MENNILGDIYQKNTDKGIRKSIGQYYTPEFIIKYIINKTVDKGDIIKNPYISVVDISCGAGYFLMAAYDVLKGKFLLGLEELKEKYKEEIYELEKDNQLLIVKGKDYWKEENLHYHILKHCIYGADKDKTAVNLTKIGLSKKESNKLIGELNIVECDSLVKWEEFSIDKSNSKEKNRLIKFWSKKYDYIIGNPPYIGHKQLDMDYKQWLLNEYDTVFKDKSDISFCFLKRIVDILSPNGISGIITSRYFMEGPTGRNLRMYLANNTNILEIVDFYGAKIFRDVGVATAIYFFEKTKSLNNEINVNKLIDDGHSFEESEDLQETMKANLFERFQINQANLDTDRWILISKESLNIYKKIENKSKYKLGDIVTSFQGVITGCDKAFVLTEELIKKYNIEKELLKKWIKNKNVDRYHILDTELSLVYSDLIKLEKDYPNSIEFIRNYKDRLENRRECKVGRRKWYELQWGRDTKLFEQPKIVFPYKASTNRFALDYNNLYCSADIYSIIIKDEYRNKISLEYLVGLLNSRIYEFYFKLFAKKMGKGIYDYYPNSVLDMKIIIEDIIDDIENRVKQIMKLDNDNNRQEIYRLEEEINIIVGNYVGLDEKEYRIVYK
ncbi:Eco57I restriction-modification methylase domain-containing protein [Tissierella sp.]|uniref:Eco57I restriction-modification methylase domain-containing protein n=1 Tax=Tissierella sp. TaxID=41274 RepID=UPI0028B1459C|nr:N-6 DNA methylase [Tissierella sp.]